MILVTMATHVAKVYRSIHISFRVCTLALYLSIRLLCLIQFGDFEVFRSIRFYPPLLYTSILPHDKVWLILQKIVQEIAI